MDWKFIVEMGAIVFTGVLTVLSVYWRLHYHQKATTEKINDHACTLKIHAQELDKQDHEIQELELNIEKRLNDRENKSTRRLQRIEKILIRMDERLKTHATDELMKEVV